MNEARHWVEFAREDLAVAELALEHGFYAQACFHAQQCIEKVLKGHLAGLGRRIPRTHSLVDLGRLARGLGFPGELAGKAALLDSFYLSTRYPDALLTPDALPGRAEAEEAVETARGVLEWGKGRSSEGSDLVF